MTDHEFNDRRCDESEHDPKQGSFEDVRISHNGNEWIITGMLGFFGWCKPSTFLVTDIEGVKLLDPEDHESFEIALDYWMTEQGINVEATEVRIGGWIK
jgi:hypothetical protein